MRTIAICNNKGGVAKTCTAINIAAILAKDCKERVLVIDADSQHNTTDFLGGDPLMTNLADLLRDVNADGHDAVEAIQDSNYPGVKLLPGCDTLMDLDLTAAQSDRVNLTVLRQLREEIESLDPEDERGFDWCFIDCPPAFNAASSAGLLMADEVLIPVKLDGFSLAGMGNMMRQVANMRQVNPSLRLLGVLPVVWYASAHTAEWEKTLRDSRFQVFPHIRRSDKVDDTTGAYRPLVEYSPKSGACVDYRRFVRQLREEETRNG